MEPIYQQAAIQHLALRHQLDSAPPAALVRQHNPQQALVAVQLLEQQRIALAETALEAHLQQLQQDPNQC